MPKPRKVRHTREDVIARTEREFEQKLIFEQWRGRTPADALAWHREAHAEVIRTLAATPADWFARREHSPEWPADFDGHSVFHRVKDIEAALGKRVGDG